MQIRQLDALQNMSRSAASKVIFGKSFSHLLNPKTPQLTPNLVPMNLGTMGGGSSGLDPVMNQIAASGNGETSGTELIGPGHHQQQQGQQGGNNTAMNAGMISSMAQL
jgi:hypothetical protein